MSMSAESLGPDSSTNELVRRAGAGDASSLARVFEAHRDRLKRMIRLRLDPRLRGRLDPSDVLQEAYLDVARRIPEFARNPNVPLFVWLRQLAAQRLIDLHRLHLGTQARDASLEVSLHHGPCPQASSITLAAHLLGRSLSPSDVAMRAELRIRVQEALDSLDPIDREVLVLRHFEMLTNDEVAEVLQLKKAAASNRYVRALKRLSTIFAQFPEYGG